MEPTLALRSAALLPPPAASVATRSLFSLLHRKTTCSSASCAGLWRPIHESGRRNGISISSGRSDPIVEGGEDEEDGTLSFLSLSEKPDRSLAVLDDYELEELDSDPPNHKSGRFFILCPSSPLFYVVFFLEFALFS